MSEPFLSELKIVSFSFPPKGWALCNGQFLPINQNQALFALLGTTYGGNGQTTFQLPDLRGRTPIHEGDGLSLGEKAGEEVHTLSIPEMPTHAHLAQASSAAATTDTPASTTLLGGSAPNDLYTGAAALVSMIPSTITSFGGSQPHENRQPYLVLNVIIALSG